MPTINSLAREAPRRVRWYRIAVPCDAPIPPAIRAALANYRSRLDTCFPGRLRDFRLYGSRARGTAHAESDTDVFVVLDSATRDELRLAIALTGDVLDETDVHLSAAAYSTDDLARLATIGSPYLASVLRDGVAL